MPCEGPLKQVSSAVSECVQAEGQSWSQKLGRQLRLQEIRGRGGFAPSESTAYLMLALTPYASLRPRPEVTNENP